MSKKINLNYFVKTDDADDADLTIIPMKVNNQHMPVLHFKSKRKSKKINKCDDASWYNGCQIATTGSPEEYASRVEWWFNSATDDYKKLVAQAYRRVPRIDEEISRAKMWLLTCSPSNRKSNIHRFLQNWLNVAFRNAERLGVARG